MKHLNLVTQELNFLDQRSHKGKQILFNGIVGKNGFRISKVTNRADSFIPIILGRVEPTHRGCIIFINYRLFASSVFFLVFWSIILAAFTALYLFLIPNFLYAGICTGLGITNYLLAMYFFHRQVKASRAVFYQLINFQMKD